MAPKTRVPKRPRSSHQDESHQSPLQQPMPSTPRSVSRGSMTNRSVDFGRTVDFDFLDREGFVLGDCLRFQGWDYFCRTSVPIYMELVREFYQNANFEISHID